MADQYLFQVESNSRASSPGTNQPSPSFPQYTPFHQQQPQPYPNYQQLNSQPYYAQPSLPAHLQQGQHGGGQGGQPYPLHRQQGPPPQQQHHQQQPQQPYSSHQQHQGHHIQPTHPANTLLNLKRTHSDTHSPSTSPSSVSFPGSSSLHPPHQLSQPPSRSASTGSTSASTMTAKKMRNNAYAPAVADSVSASASGSGSEDESMDDSDDDQTTANVPGLATKAGAASKGKGKSSKVKSEEAGGSATAGGKAAKAKATRGSRACTVCRKLKMRCFSEDGPPCKRCKAGNHECVFEESNRGKKSSKKHEAMAQSLRKMEKTLDTVLRSIHNPTLASMSSGMVTRSPSPTSPIYEGAGPSSLRQHTLPPIHTLGYHPSSSAEPVASQGSNSQASRDTFAALMARGAVPVIEGGSAEIIGASSSASVGRSGSENPSNSSGSVRPGLLSDNGGGGAHAHSFPGSSAGSGPYGGPQPPNLRHAHSGSGTPSGSHPLPPHHRPHQLSPRLHSLPDNSLNPLGLLAEASLHNHKRAEARGLVTDRSGIMVRNLLNGGGVDGIAGAGATGGSPAKAGSPAGEEGTKGKGKGKGKAEDGKTEKKEGGGGEGEGEEEEQNGKPAQEEEVMGVAGTGYFRPGPMTMLPLRRIIIERSIRPEILDFLSIDEVTELFTIYFDLINPQIPILDRSFHTPALVASRSPFLLTTVCSIAAKFYEKRPELSGKLNTYVRKLAFDTPSMGYKSVEIVQAYLMLTSYGLPVERFEQDRTWLLLGMGIRVATDLNLQRKSALSGKDTDEAKARDREIINRERTWLMCYVLDRSLSAQMGKPYSIREDYIIRNASQWVDSNRFSMPEDRGLVAYTGLQQILSRSLDFVYSGVSTASGLQADIDYPLLLRSVEAQLNVWRHEWELALKGWAEGEPDEIRIRLRYSAAIGRFYHSYALLMINSFGLQSALERSPIDLGHFFAKVSSAAMTVVAIARDELGPTGRLRHAPDSTFVMLSYAILSLLKLLRPELAIYHDSPARVISIATEAVTVLENAAMSPIHTPALYATLLRSLLSSSNGDSRPNSVPGTPAYPRGGPSRPASRGGFHPHQNGGDPTLNGGAGDAPMSAGPDSAGFGAQGQEWSQNAFYAHPDGGSMGYGMEFAMGSGAGGVNPDAPNSANGGVDFGAWGAGGGEMNLESLWGSNGNAGLFDSMLMPGYAQSMEFQGGVVHFGNGGSGAITPYFPSSPTYQQGGPSSNGA